MKFNIGWYVLYVKSYNEKKVYEVLKENDLESYVPLMKTIRKWSDRKKTIYKPIFPSYVFVNLKSPKEFNDVLDIDGACAYIRFGKEYARISENEINKIKILTGTDDITEIEVMQKIYKVGDVHKILYGPLSGLDCEIVDNLDKIGGQCIELYPDKPIYDLPAISECTGEELTNNLINQLNPFDINFHLNERVDEVKKEKDNRIDKTYNG